MTPENSLLEQLGIGDEYAEPYNDYVLVRPVDPETTTPSGLHLPSTARPTVAPIGRVMAVAPLYDPANLEPGTQTITAGDRIIYDPSCTLPVEVNGERLVMLTSDGIVGIIRTKGAP